MSDAPVTECPEGGSPAERKISGGAGFLFKGEGFYITDSRSEDYKKKASADGGHAAPATAPKAEPKTESKAESKTDGKSGSGASEPAAPKASPDS
jgi:hypothetical protein